MWTSSRAGTRGAPFMVAFPSWATAMKSCRSSPSAAKPAFRNSFLADPLSPLQLP